MFVRLFSLSLAASFCVCVTSLAHAENGVITRNFSYVSEFGTPGTGNRQFDLIEDMTFGPDGNLYVVDRFNERVQVLDSNGAYITQFGTAGGGAGQFNSPYGIAFAANGNILVSDLGNSRVQIFDAAYNPIGSFGSAGGGNGQFANMTGITLDASGNIYVADGGNSRIQVFNSAGVYQRQFSTTSFPIDGGLTADGKYIVTGYGSSLVVMYNAATGASLGTFAPTGVNPGQVTGPVGIDIDDFDNVYITNIGGTRRIQAIAQDGTVLFHYSNIGSGVGQFNEVRNILAADDGRIYVSDYTNNKILIFNLTSTETFSASPPGGDERATLPASALILNASGTFGDDFIDYDSLEMNGVSWTLSGTNTFSDYIAINSGILTNNGTLAAPDITIANGAAMTGTGTYVGNIAMNGTIAPGNSIGTLNITGDYTHGAAATYDLEVDNTGQSDVIAVTGAVTLSGGAVNVIAAPGVYPNYALYTILTATNGVTGTFGTLTGDLAFLSPVLVYNANDVQLTWGINNLTFADYASNVNEASAATALDAYADNGLNGDTQAQTVLAGMTQTQAAVFLDETTPNEIASMPIIQRNIVQGMQQPLQQRLSDTAIKDNEKNLASLSPAAGGNNGKNVWVQAIAGVVNHNGTNETDGYRHTTFGTRAGMDKALSPTRLVGVSLAVAQGNTRFADGKDKAQTSYGHADIYGQRRIDDLILDGFIGGGFGRMHTSRFISGGGLNRTAEGATGVYDISSTLKASKLLQGAYDTAIIPSITASGGWYRQNAFTESGAGSLNLRMDSVNTAPITITPMIDIQKTFTDTENGTFVTPAIGVGATWYAHDREMNISGRFAQSASSVPGFSVAGTPQKEVALNLQMSVTVEPFDRSATPRLDLRAGGTFDGYAAAYSASVHVTWNW